MGAQWTQNGSFGDSQARLTWVNSGAVINHRSTTRPRIHRRTAHTNNTGELTAMYCALERALGRLRRPHVIHSDSLYTIHMTTGRWMTRRKGARNRDLTHQSMPRAHCTGRRLQRGGAGYTYDTYAHIYAYQGTNLRIG